MMKRKSTAEDEPQYYNFLFIDPRKFENNSDLPKAWESFLSAIFFIGKSKISSNMPEYHLGKADELWADKSRTIDEKLTDKNLDDKLRRILGIWKAENKVIVLHVLRERNGKIADKRKSAMNKTFKKTKLKKKGKCYNHEFIAKNYSEKKKEKGINLLLQAFHECLPPELKPECLKSNPPKQNDEKNAKPKQECEILKVGPWQKGIDAKSRYKSVDVEIFVETIIVRNIDNPKPPTPQPKNDILKKDPSKFEPTDDPDSLNTHKSDAKSDIHLKNLTAKVINKNPYRRAHSYNLRSRKPKEPSPPPSPSNTSPDYLYLKDIHELVNNIEEYKDLEQTAFKQFEKSEPFIPCACGRNTNSFKFVNYLLIDPRKYDKNLKTLEDLWKSFLSAIFYVGKGKGERPYNHVRDAIRVRGRQYSDVGTNSKLQRIMNIWDAKKAVIILWLFLDKAEEEALTREALMIDTIRLRKLCNRNHGIYYGEASEWRTKKKLKLGMYLIYQAFLEFCKVDESQLEIPPPDSPD